MAVMEKPVTTGVNNGGITDLGNGLMMYVGTGVFTTTGTTVTIYHPFGTGDIFFAVAKPLTGTWDGNDAAMQFTLTTSTANTLKRDTTYGTLKAVTSGAAQVLRDASGTSGGAFCIMMIGRSRR